MAEVNKALGYQFFLGPSILLTILSIILFNVVYMGLKTLYPAKVVGVDFKRAGVKKCNQ